MGNQVWLSYLLWSICFVLFTNLSRLFCHKSSFHICSHWFLGALSVCFIGLCLFLYQYQTIVITVALPWYLVGPILPSYSSSTIGFHGSYTLPYGFLKWVRQVPWTVLSVMRLVQCHRCSIIRPGLSLWKVVLYSGLGVSLLVRG